MEWLLQNTHTEVDWNYAMVTLVFRFFAVFFVLAFIQISLQFASFVVRRIEANEAGSASPAAQAGGPAAPATTTEGLDGATAAAIGLAIDLEYRPMAIPPRQAGPSPWASAGRIRQLKR